MWKKTKKDAKKCCTLLAKKKKLHKKAKVKNKEQKRNLKNKNWKLDKGMSTRDWFSEALKYALNISLMERREHGGCRGYMDLNWWAKKKNIYIYIYGPKHLLVFSKMSDNRLLSASLWDRQTRTHTYVYRHTNKCLCVYIYIYIYIYMYIFGGVLKKERSKLLRC